MSQALKGGWDLYTQRENIWLKGSLVLSLEELKEGWPN